MAENTTTVHIGLGFCGLLTILFIGLKLTDHIDWSWWWVLSPIWLPIAVLLGSIGIGFVGVCFLGICSLIIGLFFER